MDFNGKFVSDIELADMTREFWCEAFHITELLSLNNSHPKVFEYL